ncbi:hypothetical protein [Bacteroides oleiciplenus]|uniref:Uncharacterized protein n=1 Tax=Bacteroides oleiciplenus TaxID=626931 RepID=A0A3E5B210_9BACE|nr:hypothetical protein [Bacteroides oleiciplenus]RGN31606.1 hypothetical protein DXB65_20120 [Bacteroides oleiciplenus]
MEAMKQERSFNILRSLPEMWYIALIGGYLLFSTYNWIIGKGTDGLLIPVSFLVVLGLLIRLLIRRSRVLGGIISSVFALCSVYMLFALFSEFSEFPVVNGQAIELIVVGGILIGGSLTAAITMLKRAIIG